MRFFVVTLNAHPTPAGVRREPNALRRLFSSSHSIADSGLRPGGAIGAYAPEGWRISD